MMNTLAQQLARLVIAYTDRYSTYPSTVYLGRDEVEWFGEYHDVSDSLTIKFYTDSGKMSDGIDLTFRVCPVDAETYMSVGVDLQGEDENYQLGAGGVLSDGR